MLKTPERINQGNAITAMLASINGTLPSRNYFRKASY